MVASYDGMVSINEVSSFEWRSTARDRQLYGPRPFLGLIRGRILAIRNRMRLIIVQYNVVMELHSIYPAEEIGHFGSKSCSLLPQLERRVEHYDEHYRIQ